MNYYPQQQQQEASNYAYNYPASKLNSHQLHIEGYQQQYDYYQGYDYSQYQQQ